MHPYLRVRAVVVNIAFTVSKKFDAFVGAYDSTVRSQKPALTAIEVTYWPER